MNTEHKTTEGEIKEIWERLTKGEASIKSAHHRIDMLQELSKSVQQLALSTTQIAIETKALREDYSSADKRIETLESKPAKRYESIVEKIILTLCGAVAGYLFNLFLN